jgi:hypothetical protein
MGQTLVFVNAPGNLDDRRDTDRRSRPTPIFSRYWFWGRRRGGRRDDENENIYVDRYTPGELALVAGVLVLSVLDMVFTLVHLNAGGTEANPVMAWVLEWGGHAGFRAVKLLATFLGLGVLLVHVRFRRVKRLLAFAFLLYLAIFAFHIYLAVMRTGTLA